MDTAGAVAEDAVEILADRGGSALAGDPSATSSIIASLRFSPTAAVRRWRRAEVGTKRLL